MTQAELSALWNEVLKWALPAVLGWNIRYLWKLGETIAIIVTKQADHEKRLDRHESSLGKVRGCRDDD